MGSSQLSVQTMQSVCSTTGFFMILCVRVCDCFMGLGVFIGYGVGMVGRVVVIGKGAEQGFRLGWGCFYLCFNLFLHILFITLFT